MDRRNVGEENKTIRERRRGEERIGGGGGGCLWRCMFWKSRPEAAGSR